MYVYKDSGAIPGIDVINSNMHRSEHNLVTSLRMT